MWLVYLRFDDRGAVKTYHVRTGSKADVEYLVKISERHGLFVSEQLVEYAAFSVSGTIKTRPMIVPNFHYYEHAEFVRRWEAVERGDPPCAVTGDDAAVITVAVQDERRHRMWLVCREST